MYLYIFMAYVEWICAASLNMCNVFVHLHEICGINLCSFIEYVECICASSWHMWNASVQLPGRCGRKRCIVNTIRGINLCIFIEYLEKNVCFRQICANEVNLLTDFTVYCTYSWSAWNATTNFITSLAKPTRAWSYNFVLNVRAYLQACTFWLWLFSSYVYYSLVYVCLCVSAVTIVTTSFDRISFEGSS
jgi:hypothetical protein